jgi:hypothetical protein
MCRLTDEGGALSEWLSQYVPGKKMQADWIVLPMQGTNGRGLDLVTSVGIVELREAGSADGRFVAEIGNGRILEIEYQQDSGPDLAD